MFKLIRSDYARYVDVECESRGPISSFLHVLLFCKGFHFVVGYRIKYWLCNKRNQLGLSRYLWVPTSALYNRMFGIWFQILLKSTLGGTPSIGKGFYLSSRGNIIIGLTCAGENLSVFDHVTIGMNIGSTRKPPELGNNVTVSQYSVVTGEKIGDNVLIHPHTVLTKSIPANLSVSGIPAVIIKNTESVPKNGRTGCPVREEYKGFFYMVKSDVRRCRSRISAKNKCCLEILVMPTIQCCIVYRFGQFIRYRLDRDRYLLPRVLMSVLYHIMHTIARLMYGIDININADIDEGFYLGHIGGVSVGQCVIGKNCNIGQQTAIFGTGRGVCPVIGSNVWVGAGAVIAGNITIGSGCTVSAGSFICADFPEGVLVAGDPARILSTDYDNSHLI